MTQFQTIGLISKSGDESLTGTLCSLLDYLVARKLKVVIDQSAASLLKGTGLPSHKREDLGRLCDLAIIIGGDGTLLHTARSLLASKVPLLGINRGRLGFLVDILPDEISEKLDEILAGHYQEDLRFLLHGQVYRQEKLIGESDAFNDIVLHVSEIVRMIEFETYINDIYVNTQRADGLIVSTPTGSTAYALSGGGPIIHPDLEAVVLVPICPHTLSSRPIVVNSANRIELVMCDNNHLPAIASFDGQINIELQAGDRIHIQQKPIKLQLIQPQDYDYFEILRAKLKWGEQP